MYRLELIFRLSEVPQTLYLRFRASRRRSGKSFDVPAQNGGPAVLMEGAAFPLRHTGSELITKVRDAVGRRLIGPRSRVRVTSLAEEPVTVVAAKR
jgi:hypothetical protein